MNEHSRITCQFDVAEGCSQGHHRPKLLNTLMCKVVKDCHAWKIREKGSFNLKEGLKYEDIYRFRVGKEEEYNRIIHNIKFFLEEIKVYLQEIS